MKRHVILGLSVLLAVPASLPGHDAHSKAVRSFAIDQKTLSLKADRSSMLERMIRSIPAEPANLDRETQCLAQAIYFEARGEPIEGQLAVGQVVMNRVESRRYPNSVCKVVFQNERMRHRCQFSFACDGKSDRPQDWRAWNVASRIAIIAKGRSWNDVTSQATHYHASYVSPHWSREMDQTAEFGAHRFFRASGGQ